MEPQASAPAQGPQGRWGRWLRRGLPPSLGFPLAVLLPALVAIVTYQVDDPSYRIGSAYLATVAVVAALAGTWPAVVATALAFVGFWLTIVPPARSFDLEAPAGPVSLATFLLSAGAVVLVVHQRDQAARRSAAFQRRYRRLADMGLIGVLFWQLEGPVTGANDAFLRTVGYSRDDLEAGRIDWRALTPPEYEAVDEEKVAELAVHGFHEPYEKEYVRKDGTRVPVLVGTAFLQGSDREGVSFVLDVSERWEHEAEREMLLAAEREARREAETANRRLEVVASASAALMAEADPEGVLRRLVTVVVPELVDVATVFVPEGDLLRRAWTAHATRPDLAEVLTLRFPVTVRSGSPVAECFRTGRTVEVPSVRPEGNLDVSADTEYLRAVADMGLTSGVVLPVRAGGEVLGVLSLSGTTRRPLEPGAVLAASQIADRAALSLQKAQSLAEERRVATIMQRALLPDSERHIEGHEVGTCYVPAAVGREIGGDWWDVLPLPDGRVAIVVGDVSGHGVHVAPSMAKLRHSIDGVLTHGAGPADAVTAASRLLEVSRPGSYATAFVATYDPRTRTLVYSRAGHPAPVLLLDDEVVELDHPGGTLLGLQVGERHQTELQLPEHFELIAFTDGLVEEPGLPYDEGVARLVRAARALPAGLAGQQRAERLVADVVGTSGRDDVCVVMVRPSPGS